MGGVELSSPAGKITIQVINAVTEFERDLLIERTQSGLARAKIKGKKFGRPSALKDIDKQLVMNLLSSGTDVSEIARKFKTSRQTILRVRTSFTQI